MDIAIAWDSANFRGDWTVTPGDLAADPGGLRSAVLLSLFTDRVASSDYLPPPGELFTRRGWWADTYEPSPIGSRLWQLNRSKKADSRLFAAEAQDMCREALQWLVDDGVVSAVTVDVGWITPQTLGIVVTISKPGQAKPETFRFDWAWQGA